MPRRNYFPGPEELSSLLQNATPTDSQRENDAISREIAIQKAVTQSMRERAQVEKENTAMMLDQQATHEAAAMLPALQSLNPADPDYELRLTETISANPYGAQDPAVQKILQVQGQARSHVQQMQQRASEIERQRADHAQALSEREQQKADILRLGIVQQGGSDSLARFDKMVNEEKRDPFEAAAHVASVNESQTIYANLGKAGITDDVIQTLKDPKTGLLDKFKAEAAMTDFKKSMIDDDQGKYAVKFIDSINKAKAAGDEVTEEQQKRYDAIKPLADDWLLQAARNRAPKAAPGTPAATGGAAKPAVPGKPISTPDGKKVNFSVE